MPQWRDFLERFRPAGTPGAAAQGGVPADRTADMATELEPVFMLLGDVHAAAARIIRRAAEQADEIRQDAGRQAAEIVARAQAQAETARAEAAVQSRALDSCRKHPDGSREGPGARRTEGTGRNSNARLQRPRGGWGSSAAGGVLRTVGRAARCPAMSTAWVAGNVRAKAMLDRRIGSARARELAATGSLAQGEQILVDGPYRHGVQVGQALEEAEHALAATVLWHLRVLAGWQPRAGARALRLLAGWFEIANISGHARALAGAAVEPSFHLGALGTAWSRLRTTASLAELRRVLTQSLWGDPGGDSPSDIALGVQLAWAFRVETGVAEAREWACGGAAVLVARRLFLEERPLARRRRPMRNESSGGRRRPPRTCTSSAANCPPARAGLWPARPI